MADEDPVVGRLRAAMLGESCDCLTTGQYPGDKRTRVPEAKLVGAQSQHIAGVVDAVDHDK